MALRSRNKVTPNFNMSSMTDIVFLLLIFFMLTSTLVSPNALKLLLPNSKSKTLEKQTISISIDKNINFYIDENQVDINELETRLINRNLDSDSSIKTRINKAKDEILLADKFDYIVENNILETSYSKVLELVNSFINE